MHQIIQTLFYSHDNDPPTPDSRRVRIDGSSCSSQFSKCPNKKPYKPALLIQPNLPELSEIWIEFVFAVLHDLMDLEQILSSTSISYENVSTAAIGATVESGLLNEDFIPERANHFGVGPIFSGQMKYDPQRNLGCRNGANERKFMRVGPQRSSPPALR